MQFIRSTSPLGEETAPPPLSLQEWMKDPKDRSTDNMWFEDRIPQQDFVYGPNSKSRRYRLYNKGIVPAFALSPLLYFTPTATLGQQVARGLYPPIDGVNMEDVANQENTFRNSEMVRRKTEEKRLNQMREFEERQRATQGP